MMKTPQPLETFLSETQNSLSDGTFVKITLGAYHGAEENLKNIYIKKILIKDAEKLSFTYRYKTRDIVKNCDPAGGIEKIKTHLCEGFSTAALLTTAFDMHFECRGGKNPLLKKSMATIRDAPSPAHDRQKKRHVETRGKSYLHKLEITDEAGNVYDRAQDKYRQIDKYIEVMGGLIKKLPPRDTLTIADMGAGKGYLTFALYDYLTSVLNLNVQMTGVEVRADLVQLCNDIAKKSDFASLDFQKGTIQDFDAAGTNVLIALHACDTATDDAIFKGIRGGADLIVVAPCCHKQIRREMEKTAHGNDFLLKHGIFLERQAEMVTDSLRALYLEYSGYNAKVFEFISDAHTPKNVMITAVRNQNARPYDKKILARIEQAKSQFGITRHYLGDLIKAG